VLETTVQLEPGDPEALKSEVTRLFDWRQRGTPFNQPCCGSVFKNPDRAVDGVRRTAGQLIEAAGLKGRIRRGNRIAGPRELHRQSGRRDGRDVRASSRKCRRRCRRDSGSRSRPR